MKHDVQTSIKVPARAVPQSRDEICDWVRLCRSRRVGPVTFVRLIREHGNATDALKALPDVAARAGVPDYVACPPEDAMAELVAGKTAGARIICLGSPEYPPLLALIADPPPFLWAIGDTDLLLRPAVAMVGARNASSLGRRMAGKLASGMAGHGYCVVSGLARGIDAAVHQAALEGGTIAVQAGGVDVIYPRENSELAAMIATMGVRVSEMAPGVVPQARHFPGRNRIISGMATGLVVIEGASRSGSLITARDALDQGREVMAVPGSPLDSRTSGCNMLIRDGATLVRSAADISEALSIAPDLQQTNEPARTAKTSVTEAYKSEGEIMKTVLSLIGPDPVPEDTIIRETGFRPEEVLTALVDLELLNKITRSFGGNVAMAV